MVLVASEVVDIFRRGYVPEFDQLVIRRGDEPLVIVRELHAPDAVGVSMEGFDVFICV